MYILLRSVHCGHFCHSTKVCDAYVTVPRLQLMPTIALDVVCKLPSAMESLSEVVQYVACCLLVFLVDNLVSLYNICDRHVDVVFI